MTEFLMYVIEKDPNEAFPRLKDGETVKVVTGDPWFDEISRRMEAGESLELADVMDPEDAKAILNQNKQPTITAEPPQVEEFDEKY